jgi:outer membrane protein assembly factor BamB
MYYCEIDSCISTNTTSNGAGGAGLYINGGTVYAHRTTIAYNKAHNRGGGIRLQNNRPSRLTLDGCLVAGNELNNFGSGNADYGSGIQISGNDCWLYCINTTITDNVAGRNGAGINSNGDVFLISSTVSDNRATAQGGDIRLDGSDNKMHFINSIITGPATPTTSFYFQGSSGVFNSNGNNVFNTYSGTGTFSALTTDMVNKSIADVFGTNVLADNNGYPKTWAPQTLLSGATVAELEAFKQQYGLVQGNAALDARGYYRKEKAQVARGAYDGNATVIPIYTLGYVLNEGDTSGLNLPTTYTVEQTPINFEAFIPLRTGHVFIGWTPSVLEAGTTGDTVITANWVLDTFDVVFYRNAAQIDTVQRITYGGHPASFEIDSANCTFMGWYTDTFFTQLISLANFTVTSDTALYAKWLMNATPTYKVYFEVEGIKVDSQVVEENTVAAFIAAPVREGYVFEYWRNSAGVQWDFGTMLITQDTTLYALYTKRDTFVVATPVILPLNTDSNYIDSLWVSITCDTVGAVIYYSLDGSVPSTEYTAPFKLSVGVTTVKAMATKVDVTYIVYENSNIATAVYTIVPAPEPPSMVAVQWGVNLGKGNLFSASPAMSPDGNTVYFSNGVVRNLYAINASDGSSKWNFSLGSTENSDVKSSVSIDNAGVIYAPTGTGTGTAQLFAVNPNGTQKWVHEIGSGANIEYITPVITKSGNIVTGNRGTGGSTRILSSADGTQIDKSAKEAENIVATQDNYLYTMSRSATNGICTYVISTGDMFSSSIVNWLNDGRIYPVGAMAVDANGNVYGASGGGDDGAGSIFSIKRDGDIVTSNWQYAVSGKIEQSGVVLGTDGTVYVNGHENNKIYALTSNGTLKWEFATEAGARSVPAIDNNGYLHFGDDAGNYYIIRDDGTEATLINKEKITINGISSTQIFSSPLIDSSGNIYFTCKAKRVEEAAADSIYLFKITVNGVASYNTVSAWAMKGGNIQRTGLQKKTIPTANEENVNIGPLVVYPNPASSELNVVVPSTGKPGMFVQNGTVRIYDIAGRCVMQEVAGSATTVINVSSLKAGAYVIEFGGKKAKFVKK